LFGEILVGQRIEYTLCGTLTVFIVLTTIAPLSEILCQLFTVSYTWLSCRDEAPFYDAFYTADVSITLTD